MLSIRRFKHCVFDFDGVIVDSERKKFDDLRNVLSDYDVFLSDSEFINFSGKKRAYFLKEKNIVSDDKISEIMVEVHKRDLELSSYVLIKGLLDFLEYLRLNEVDMHIATGSSENFVLKLLDKFKIRHYFTHIITGDQVLESKPSPKIYLEIKKLLGTDSVFVVEDSLAGVESAKNAGLFVVSFIEDNRANMFVHDFAELLDSLR